jgi:hypothetical protein
MTTTIPLTQEKLSEVIAKLKAMLNRKHLPADGRGIYLGDGVHDSIRAQDVIDMLEELQRLREHSSKEEAEPIYQVKFCASCEYRQVTKDEYEKYAGHWRRILHTEPPSFHQAAASMKRFADAVEKLAFSMPAPNPYTPKFVQLAIEAMQAIPTVEESK